MNYLTATIKPVGSVLNFGRNGVEIKREVRVLAKKDNPVISCLSCLKDLLDFI